MLVTPAPFALCELLRRLSARTGSRAVRLLLWRCECLATLWACRWLDPWHGYEVTGEGVERAECSAVAGVK